MDGATAGRCARAIIGSLSWSTKRHSDRITWPAVELGHPLAVGLRGVSTRCCHVKRLGDVDLSGFATHWHTACPGREQQRVICARLAISRKCCCGEPTKPLDNPPVDPRAIHACQHRHNRVHDLKQALCRRISACCKRLGPLARPMIMRLLLREVFGLLAILRIWARTRKVRCNRPYGNRRTI